MPDSRGLIVCVERKDADQLILTDTDGTWPRALTTNSQGDHWDPQPSPDGRLAAFLYRPFDDLNRLDLRIVDIASGEIRILRGLPKVRMWMPRWSPDGRMIAFISQEAGHDDVWLIRPNGQAARQLTKEGYDFSELVWSPDGTTIAATMNRDASFEMVLIEAETGEVSNLRDALGTHTHPSWSPDGKWLTFEFKSPIQQPDVFRLNVATKKVTQLTFSESLDAGEEQSRYA